MTETQEIAERLKAIARVQTELYSLGDAGATATYLGLIGCGDAETEEEATAAALLDLAEKLLQVRDHVTLLLAPDIDPTKCQRLPRVVL